MKLKLLIHSVKITHLVVHVVIMTKGMQKELQEVESIHTQQHHATFPYEINRCSTFTIMSMCRIFFILFMTVQTKRLI